MPSQSGIQSCSPPASICVRLFTIQIECSSYAKVRFCMQVIRQQIQCMKNVLWCRGSNDEWADWTHDLHSDDRCSCPIWNQKLLWVVLNIRLQVRGHICIIVRSSRGAVALNNCDMFRLLPWQRRSPGWETFELSEIYRQTSSAHKAS